MWDWYEGRSKNKKVWTTINIDNNKLFAYFTDPIYTLEYSALDDCFAMLLTTCRKKKKKRIVYIQSQSSWIWWSAPQGYQADKLPSILFIEWQTSTYILNDHLCPSHFFFVSYSIIHIHIPLSSECENESEKEILDRSIDLSFHCIVIIFYFIYIYMCSRRQNKLTTHSLGTRRQTSTIEQVVKSKNSLDTRQ